MVRSSLDRQRGILEAVCQEVLEMPLRKNRIDCFEMCLREDKQNAEKLAGGPGIEPGQPDPETGVLPLDDPPT